MFSEGGPELACRSSVNDETRLQTIEVRPYFSRDPNGQVGIRFEATVQSIHYYQASY